MRAEFQKSYLTRYLLLATVCLGMSAWFAYDGFIGYPSQLKYAEAYDEIRELPSREIEQRWKDITAENNWPTTLPKKRAEEIRGDITGQYFWALLSAAVGIPALLLYFRSRGSWVESTEQGLRTSWGQEVDFSNVQQLNKHRWQKKGIAKALYQEGDQQRSFTFDDFKFDREPLGAMLRQLEAKLTDEQIVGGSREAEPKADEDEHENAGAKDELADKSQ